MDKITPTELCQLKPTLLVQEVEEICQTAIQNKVAAIVVPPIFVQKVKELIGTNAIEVTAVIGYPYGYQAIEAKIAEILLAIVDGADQLEVVMNTIALKNNDWQYLAKEINYILPVIKNKNKKLTIILETAYLTESEIIQCCDLYGIAGIDTICAGTGVAEKTTPVKTIMLLRKHLAEAIQLKAICSKEDDSTTDAFLDAGANRIGIMLP